MKIKKIISISLFSLLSIVTIAQKHNQYKVRKLNTCQLHRCMLIEDKKEFINNHIQLTPDESKVVWKLYEQREESINHSRDIIRLAINTKHNEAYEYDKTVNLILKENENILNTRNNFYIQLKKILPSEKIIAFMKAEKDFKHQLIKQMECRRSKKGK